MFALSQSLSSYSPASICGSFKLPRPHEKCLKIPSAEPSDASATIISEENEKPEVSEHQQVTGTTKYFLHNWRKLTHSKFVLNLITGIKIDFISPPLQCSPPNPIQFGDNDLSCIDVEIETLASKGAILPVTQTKLQFVSTIFTRPKTSGGFRTIINLEKLNWHLAKRHFKMEHIPTILPLIKRNAFMTSIDLQDAYFSVPSVKHHHKYLHFMWRETLYEFQCLCFGLSLAPFYFTKAMKLTFSKLQREGIHCTHYIDDSLYINTSKEQLERDTARAKDLLQSLGFTINLEESSFHPSKQITHLGFIIDSETYTMCLPIDKVEKIQQVCTELLNARQVTIHHFAKGIGLLVSSYLAVNYAQLHTRYLEIYKTEQLKCCHKCDTLIYLSGKIRSELQWWVKNIENQNDRSISDIFGFDHWHYEIYSGASKVGWGAALFRNSQLIQRTGGRWSTRETRHHINYLELKASQFALLAFKASIQDSKGHVKCDNTTAISYINKFGGCHNVSLTYLSRQMWLWCIDHSRDGSSTFSDILKGSKYKNTPKDHTQTIIIVLIIMPERSRTIEMSKALYLQNQN